MNYTLPETVEVGGVEYSIRTDFRAALDIIAALKDPDLTDYDRAVVALRIFYPESVPPDPEEALKRCFWFLACGDEAPKANTGGGQLMDWEQDFKWIAAAISKMLGRDVRGEEMHWWTFISLYYEIGECIFSQIVSIRKKLSTGQKLDKSEKEFYRKNRADVDIRTRYSEAEQDLLSLLTGEKKGGG